ncbi:hypothetical protein DFQ26_001769 [Actinomortierella ambigua]|nr:hypothetical protein DFQ26_001769 [Actinomortierella ambigua]
MFFHLRGDIAAITQWDAAEEDEEDNAGNRVQYAKFDAHRSVLTPTSLEHSSSRVLAPQKYAAFESLPEHEDFGDNYTKEVVEGEQEQAQVEVEEDEVQMNVELMAIMSEFKSPQRAPLQRTP